LRKRKKGGRKVSKVAQESPRRGEKMATGQKIFRFRGSKAVDLQFRRKNGPCNEWKKKKKDTSMDTPFHGGKRGKQNNLAERGVPKGKKRLKELVEKVANNRTSPQPEGKAQKKPVNTQMGGRGLNNGQGKKCWGV